METQSIPQDTYKAKDFKRSKNAYTFECMFEYFVSLMMTDAFLAKLLSNLGFDSGTVGLISSLISLAFLFQLAAVPLTKKILNVKKTAIIFHFSSQIFFLTPFLLPFCPIDGGIKKTICVAAILLGYFGNYVVTALIYKWGNSFVHPFKRGEFNAIKEAISLAGGIVISLLAGYVLDRFEADGNLTGGFIFIAVSMFIYSLCDLVCLLLIKNDKTEKADAKKVPFKTVIKNTLGNRGFRMLIILSALYNSALYFTIGFIGVYKTGTLAMSMTLIQIITIGSNILRIFVSRPAGKYSDRTSYNKGMRMGLLLYMLAFAALCFTAPGSWWLIIVYTAFVAFGGAGTSQNNLMITYSVVGEEYFVEATSVKNCIGGVCGFVAAYIASIIVNAVEGAGNTLFGITVYGQQVLGVISFAVAAAAFLFSKFVVDKYVPQKGKK
ncbi:MAG: MFS transporter [Oscillospiraceae bacterium]|nr:MFS transporter [Candidatus Equicaccousia limihippi]